MLQRIGADAIVVSAAIAPSCWPASLTFTGSKPRRNLGNSFRTLVDELTGEI